MPVEEGLAMMALAGGGPFQGDRFQGIGLGPELIGLVGKGEIGLLGLKGVLHLAPARLEDGADHGEAHNHDAAQGRDAHPD